MITGDIKQKVDAVWQTFWNNGLPSHRQSLSR